MPRWFGSSPSAAAADNAPAVPAVAVAAPPPPPPPPPPPSREELDKLRKRVEEVAPRAYASLLASQEPGLPEGGGFDDDTLARWLVAEERDVERAAQRLAAHTEWRSALLPAGWTPDKGASFPPLFVTDARDFFLFL